MAKKREQPAYPIHKMGKHFGYEELEDGSIKIAPMYSDALRDAATQEEALRSLLATITKQCHDLMVPILQAKDRTWDRIVEDYGIEEVGEWKLNFMTRVMSRKKPDAPPSEKGTG